MHTIDTKIDPAKVYGRATQIAQRLGFDQKDVSAIVALVPATMLNQITPGDLDRLAKLAGEHRMRRSWPGYTALTPANTLSMLTDAINLGKKKKR